MSTHASQPLPAPLQAWGEYLPWLQWFAPELAPTLGVMLGRLRPLVGPFRGQDRSPMGDPDGLGDLQRQGPYQRLLMTEWLLADALPDEFLRRAAQGEHLFLAPQPPRQQPAKAIVALFDGGPLQWGAPRLGQLALWILLARRAQGAGARFQWGVLQETPLLRPALTPEDLRPLLQRQASVPVSPAHLAAWAGHLGADPPGECWLVSPGLPSADGSSPATPLVASHGVRLTPGWNAGELDFQLDEYGEKGTRRASRHTTLPLPPDALGQRLLRGYWQNPPPDRPGAGPDFPPLSLTHAPVFSLDGRNVAALTLEGRSAVIFRLPGDLPSPVEAMEGSPGKPRKRGQRKGQHKTHRIQQWPQGAHPAALWFQEKKLGVLLQGGGRLRFWRTAGAPDIPQPPREALQLAPGVAQLQASALLSWGDAHHHLLLVDQGKRLVAWAKSDPEHTPQSLATGVLALLQQDTQRCLVALEVAGELEIQALILRQSRVQQHRWQRCGPLPPGARVLLGYRPSMDSGQVPVALCVAAKPRERWRFVEGSVKPGAPAPEEGVVLLPGWTAIGLLAGEPGEALTLVVTNPEKTRVGLLKGSKVEALHQSAVPIQRYHFAPRSGRLALILANRQLLVLDCHAQACIFEAGAAQAPAPESTDHAG